MDNLVNLKRYKIARKQAAYYFNMTLCGYEELAQHCSITTCKAKRWVASFTKERAKRRMGK